MRKPATRILFAAGDDQTAQTIAQVGATHHAVTQARSDAEFQVLLSQPSPVFAVIVEAKLENMSSMRILELARQMSPQALRVVVTNFVEISALIEAVHEGLIQRLLGTPIRDAEVQSLLQSSSAAGASVAFARPSAAIPHRAAV